MATKGTEYKSFDLPGAEYYTLAGLQVPSAVLLRNMIFVIL